MAIRESHVYLPGKMTVPAKMFATSLANRPEGRKPRGRERGRISKQGRKCYVEKHTQANERLDYECGKERRIKQKTGSAKQIRAIPAEKSVQVKLET